jgi:Leucine-rich repeat (LRR) protein/GTPase SAR1 family protein
LIKENIATKNPFLDLGNCGLTDASPCLELLAECTHLETLIFSETWRDWDNDTLEYNTQNTANKGRKNDFTQIPKGLPSSLKKLVVRDSQLDKIDNIEALVHLQHLDLEENAIESAESLSHLTTLKHLNLRDNRLEKIQYLDQLKQLTHLDLSANSIAGIENLGHLKELQYLNLGENGLKKIENLAGLDQLLKLELGCNQFEQIENLYNLPQLKHLILEENDIKKLENLDQLPQLTYLNLRFNSFKKLENLDALTELTDLSLGYNAIKKLENLDKLTKLQVIGVGFTGILRIENLENLTELRELWMSQTRIEKIENLDKLTNLRQLSFMCTKVAKIENLDKLTKLTYLNFHATKISKIENLDKLTKLTDLRLDGNNIAKIENLDALVELDDLMIGSNPIEKIENLGHLTKLRELDLGGLSITKIENLENLKALEQLELGGPNLTKIENLEGLTQLQSLALRGDKITKIENLEGLQKLQELDLRHTAVARIENLDQLQSLRELYLSETNITKIENLQGLLQLEKLNLCKNKITRIENLTQLPQLKELCLERNAIQCLENLGDLPALRELDLNNNQINCIKPNALPAQLAQLNLSYNQLTKIEHLAGTTGLTELDLSENKLTKIENFENLPALEDLDLGYNQIAKLENLQGLPSLRDVRVSKNQITEIAADAVSQQLQELDLEDNQISSITHLKNFTGLTHIDVESNQIAWFPIELLDLPHLTSLRLEDNPWENIPIALTEGYEVLQQLKRYLQDLAQGKTQLYQAKLILIGNGRVGKTSLVQRWLDNSFDPAQSSTHAIQLRRHVLPQLAQNEALEHVKLNVWDFGGQDIYHATHRLFMQTQAVFLLAWDAATQAQPTQTETLADDSEVSYKNYPLLYWLDYAYTLGKQSPVLVAQTKSERDGVQAPPQLSDALKTHYQVQHCLALDAAVDDKNKNGFKELNTALQTVLAQAIKRTCTDLPASWWRTQQAIETLQQQGQQTLDKEAFQALCQAHEVPQASYHTLQSYFHNSGVFFYHEGLFNDQIILNQQWAIDAVYTLFDRQGMFMRHRNSGFFTGGDLSLSWQDKSRSEQELLLSFMESCELCIDIKRPRDKYAPHHILPLPQRKYLAPQLLPNTSIELSESLFPADGAGVYLKFCHPMLHEAVMHRFILRTHHFAQHAHIRQQAIFLKLGNTQALVQAFPANNELVVKLNAPDTHLLSQLRNELHEVQGNAKDIAVWASVNGQGYVALDALTKQNTEQLITDNGEVYDRAAFEVFLAWDKGARLGK